MKKKNNNKPTQKGQVLSLFSDCEDEENPSLPERPPEEGKTITVPGLPVAPLPPVARPAAASEPDLTDGRDELNLAEFPLTTLSDRPQPGVERLTFSDVVYDSGDAGRPVNRTLTVTPAVGLGLPTPTDGDVLLALVQLTRWANGFTDRRTDFTRYQIVKLLRWPDCGTSYERVEQSLNRWMGVTLFFDRAWWDKRQKAWVNEKFHLLDRVSLRATRDGTSSFTWGEVPFNSFRAENIKRIDLQAYFDLKLPSSRRLYRFLDKRFHQREAVSFDLRVLACEHVGFSRDCPNAELKRRVQSAVCELEAASYIEAVPADERYVSPHHGQWRAFFRKKVAPAPAEGLAAELVGRGVSAPVAAALVAQYPAERVQTRLNVLDWLIEQKDPRVARNPPGYLIQSLRADYAPPPDYQPARPTPTPPPPTPAAVAPVKPAPAVVAPPAASGPSPVDAYLGALDAPSRAKLEADALAADPASAGHYARGSSEAYRQAALRRAVNALVGRILAGPPV